jgi:hypothetical protein
MDDRHSKKRKSSSKPESHPSLEEKEAMTASLEKARLKEVHPAQPTPLEPPPSFAPLVVDLGTAASNLSAVSDTAATHDYDYGDRYGGVQSTRYNSNAVDDKEQDARNEYYYQQGRPHRSASSAPGYPAHFSAPFYQADVYGQGHHASTAYTRESTSPVMERMEKLMKGIERASAASALAIQSFLVRVSFIVFVEIISSSMDPVERPLSAFHWKGVGSESCWFPAGFPELCH